MYIVHMNGFSVSIREKFHPCQAPRGGTSTARKHFEDPEVAMGPRWGQMAGSPAFHCKNPSFQVFTGW
jgi:hypothetical protein